MTFLSIALHYKAIQNTFHKSFKYLPIINFLPRNLNAFLENIIGQGTVAADPQKIQAMIECPNPQISQSP